jgi:dTDP-4-dehydrorhamnose reductase
MKILVTGCEGMLGRTVMRRLSVGHELIGVDLEQGDLSVDGVAGEILAGAACDWVVHCAAWTDVDGAETLPDAAMDANAKATGYLARACDANEAGLCYISTDYVFDGQGDGFDEDDPHQPVNHYGLTKARGEEFVTGMAGPWQILRTSWLFGDGRVNFVKTIRNLLGKRDTLRVVDDQRGCPTYTEDLADVIGFLVSGRHHGIFHGTNAGATTWFELARQVAIGLGADPERIVPCPSSEYPTAAVRPPCSILRSTNLEKAGCPARPSWQDAVVRYLRFLESGQAEHP